MKKVYILLATIILTHIAFAKTYTITSGKWTDAKVWNNEYPGDVIKTDDVVIITGQVTMNTGITVEGTLKVEKGAFMVGMKDLVISKSGKFVNDGNTVVKRIYNEGSINNNQMMEAMTDVDNKGKIDNNNNMVAGNDFQNYGGHAKGNGGTYFVNNQVVASPVSTFGNDVRVYYGSKIEKYKETGNNSSPFSIDANFEAGNGIVLNIKNESKTDVSLYSIEKSSDGKNYTLIDMVNNKNDETGMTYTDTKINNNLTYYRVKAISSSGIETVLPVALVKAPDLSAAYTLVTQ